MAGIGLERNIFTRIETILFTAKRNQKSLMVCPTVDMINVLFKAPVTDHKDCPKLKHDMFIGNVYQNVQSSGYSQANSANIFTFNWSGHN